MESIKSIAENIAESMNMVETIKSRFLEHQRALGFNTYESFPLVVEDPTVLFTNATITPFKQIFTKDAPTSDFALVQRCLRLGGTGGTVESARTNLNYTSLFDMLGSGFFNKSHSEAVEYFIDTLNALGIDRKKLIFSSIEGHPLNSALVSSSLDPDQIRVFSDRSIMQHEWSFGEGDLHGLGVIAWFSEKGYDQKPELTECVQIGRIVHIDGISEGGEVKKFDFTAFDMGLGMGRIEIALTGSNSESMKALRKLAKQFKFAFNGISDGDAHYVSNLCRVIDELTAEGLVPGNKKQAYVLRKLIRSLIEELWLQSGKITDVQNVLSFFMDTSIDRLRVSEALSKEEISMRQILAKASVAQKKNPEMTPDELRSTFGIKPSLLKLI